VHRVDGVVAGLRVARPPEQRADGVPAERGRAQEQRLRLTGERLSRPAFTPGSPRRQAAMIATGSRVAR
jgi:hypothetical protein